MPGHVPPTSLPQKAQRGDHPQPLRAFLPSISGVPAAGPLHTWHVLGCPAWLPHAVLPWPQEVSHPSVTLSCRHPPGSSLCTGRRIHERVCVTHWVRQRKNGEKGYKEWGGGTETQAGGSLRTRASPGIIPPPPELGPRFCPKTLHFHFPFIVVLGDARSRWGGVKRNTFLLCYSILSSISVGTAGKGLSQGGSAASKLGPGKL